MSSKKLTTKKIVSSIVTLLVGAIFVYAGLQSKDVIGSSSNTNIIGVNSRVVKVVDGDTAEIEINGQKRTVRFIGMDTPETLDPRKTVQCFGREASNRAHELLDNQYVSVEYDPVVGEQDKYGRRLAYIFLPDKSLYNQRMIEEGFAHEYTYQNQAYKYQSEFKSAQVTAQTAQKGFWSATTCSGDTTKPAT